MMTANNSNQYVTKHHKQLPNDTVIFGELGAECIGDNIPLR